MRCRIPSFNGPALRHEALIPPEVCRAIVQASLADTPMCVTWPDGDTHKAGGRIWVTCDHVQTTLMPVNAKKSRKWRTLPVLDASFVNVQKVFDAVSNKRTAVVRVPFAHFLATLPTVADVMTMAYKKRHLVVTYGIREYVDHMSRYYWFNEAASLVATPVHGAPAQQTRIVLNVQWFRNVFTRMSAPPATAVFSFGGATNAFGVTFEDTVYGYSGEYILMPLTIENNASQ